MSVTLFSKAYSSLGKSYMCACAISGGGAKTACAALSELALLGFLRAVYEGCVYTYEEVGAAGVTQQRLDILLNVDDGLYTAPQTRSSKIVNFLSFVRRLSSQMSTP